MPDASIKDNDHPSHIQPSNTYVQGHDHLTNASSTESFAQLNGCMSSTSPTQSLIVNSLVRHEILLNMDGSAEKPDGAHVLSCNEVCPFNMFNISNDSYSNEVNDDTHSSITSSIASMPDIRPQNDSTFVNTNIHNAFDTNSHTPAIELALAPESLHISQEPSAQSNSEGLLDSNPDHAPPTLESTESNETCNVYFHHHSSVNEPLMYSSFTGSLNSNVYPAVPPTSKANLFDSNKHMPSLLPSRPFTLSPMSESQTKGSRATDTDVDVHIRNSHESLSTPTTGTISYYGLSRYDRRTSITFKGLTQSEAENYMKTNLAKYNDYHLVYISNVVHTIKSYCLCQDKLITNDWNVHLFRDSTYPGHPVLPGNVKLLTGGPRSGRTWREHVQELWDHRAYTPHLIHIVETPSFLSLH
ncbi:hypothetical protein P692DRAFT_20875284 [Suillus brevipes Sb2]|nr:hypothetical protein P692DRAFT_20875284 [Suillus brevipes Sb2]